MITSWTQMPFRLLTLIFLCFAGAGCEDGGGSKSNDGGGNSFAGTWLITKEGQPSYWIFNNDGTFRKNRTGEPENGGVHFTGTYSANGNALEGEFSNPGVGRGEIKAQIVSGGSLTMDFIEYWHSPAKVVRCTGVRK
jgi:hypothetical protein